MPMHILIVADDGDQRQLFALLLQHAGYAVDAVADGESGLTVLQHDHYDVVLTDYMLPGISGADVITSARRQGFAGHTVLMSDHSDVHCFARQCLADGYFRKEGLHELLALLEDLRTNP